MSTETATAGVLRTTTTAPPATSAGIGMAIADAWVMAQRNLIRYRRLPQLFIFSTVQPIMFVLLFSYVFGGAIQGTGAGVKYIDFLMPGIFVQTTLFGSTQTGVGLAEDLHGGMIERFRSLPMARSAVLAGRTLSDTVRNAFVVVLMTVVGTIIGFRFHAGVLAALAGFAMLLLVGLAFSWVSALIGLSVKEVEAAQAAGFIWIFPLTFAGSTFVPVKTMPGWLQAFAKVNPVSITVDTLRAFVLGGPTLTHVWKCLAWMLGILVVIVPLAVRRYRNAV